MLTIPTVVAVILTALSLCICVCWSRDNPLTVALKVIYLGLTVWGFVASLALASGGLPSHIYAFGICLILVSGVSFILMKGGSTIATMAEILFGLNILGSVSLLYFISR